MLKKKYASSIEGVYTWAFANRRNLAKLLKRSNDPVAIANPHLVRPLSPKAAIQLRRMLRAGVVNSVTSGVNARGVLTLILKIWITVRNDPKSIKVPPPPPWRSDFEIKRLRPKSR